MKRLFILASLLLANCAASGPVYSTLEPPHPAKARLVLYRPDSIYDMTRKFWVEGNGQQLCSLHNGSFFVKELAPGNYYLTSSRFMAIGTSKLNLAIKAGETIYAKMEVSGSRVVSGIFGGIIANTVEETVSENAGPVYLGTVSKDKAQAEMQGLHEDCQ